jgi:hypothetical protein
MIFEDKGESENMSDGAKCGDWVQVYRVILEAGERAPQVPEDTARVPLEMKVKGVLVDEKAERGDQVTIETAAGRKLEGKLVAVNPAYDVGYGPPPGELRSVGTELRRFLAKGNLS